MTEVRPDGKIEDKSLGELVSLATGNVSRLVKSEIELAKLELKDDAKRAGLGSALFVVAAFIACMVLVLVSIAIAYAIAGPGGLPRWAAFLIVAGGYVLLAGGLVGVGLLRMKKMTGIKRTRKTVKDDLAVLRRSGETDEQPALTE